MKRDLYVCLICVDSNIGDERSVCLTWNPICCLKWKVVSHSLTWISILGMTVCLIYLDSNMWFETKRSLIACMSYLDSNMRVEMNRSLSVCLSYVDHKMWVEMKCLSFSHGYQYEGWHHTYFVCLIWISIWRAKWKRSFSVCLALSPFLGLKWNAVCPSVCLA